MEAQTPMLKQYQEIKKQYPECILFFRLGDFYEMFMEDARIASKILDLVLTSREAGKLGRIPMCGIPYHAKNAYIHKLIKANKKIAICEQMEDPAAAKGLVKRDVIKIITTGTFIDENSFESRYILSLSLLNGFALAYTDSTSGIIYLAEYTAKEKASEAISKLTIYECIFPSSQEEKIKSFFKLPNLQNKNITFSAYEDWNFNTEIARNSLCEHFHTNSLHGFGITDESQAIPSAGALLTYLKQMNRMPLAHIDRLSLNTEDDCAFISTAAHYGLELDELFKTLDKTLTSLGKRALKNWMYKPLKEKIKILQRQNAVTLLKNSPALTDPLTRILNTIPDIDKNLSRISCGDPPAKDLFALRNTLTKIPELQKTLENLSPLSLFFNITDIPSLRTLLDRAINPDMPLSNPQGKIIRPGYNHELDELRGIEEKFKTWLKDLQRDEIKRTGINSLKIGFNHVFGYYIEITHSNLGAVPENYIRKQTLANAERFITPELKEFEEKMLSAEMNILKIETLLLEEIQHLVLEQSVLLHVFSSSLAELDALFALSKVSSLPGYVLPEITDDYSIDIIEGRHPVVEHYLNNAFIPNDILLDEKENHLLIITGPNMSGKSTYIRQVAVLVIMSQMGSFIPAKKATIGIVDKIFTRIGARDDISKGMSTFMVEMNETAGILNNLSQRSLVILDEIGRGTSTYDGLSLAWAITEYLQKQRVRTLFATHFHELTVLESDFTGIKNYNVAVKEWNDEVIFLHKIIPGSTDDSYGIYVAKLAGIPAECLKRAKHILAKLELSSQLHEKIRGNGSNGAPEEIQFSLFNEGSNSPLTKIKDELLTLDLDSLPALAALNKLHEWRKKLKE